MSEHDEANPYASPPVESTVPLPSAELGEAVGEADVVDLLANKKPWKLLMFADALRFEASDDQPTVDVSRTEFSDKTIVQDVLFLRRSLQVNAAKKKVFQFSVEDFAMLNKWIGPLTAKDLKFALKRRMGWIFPIGLMLIFFSMPLSGDPARGVEPLPFDPFNCGLGVSLCLFGFAAKWIPHRIFFLVDSLWVLIIACKVTYSIFSGSSWWLGIVVALQLVFVASGIKQYRRFATMNAGSDCETQ